MKNRITIAGNIIVDSIMHLEKYPRPGMLANIIGLEHAVGGCLANTLVDLKKFDSGMHLHAIGRVGNDADGKLALDFLKRHAVGVADIVISENSPTSFTYVFHDNSTSERTFFTYGGANDEITYDSISYDALDTDLFHLGYALLLAGMDREDPDYGTVMAKTLARVQSKGIRTSLDAVSEDSERAGRIIRCSLKYCNYVIINEEEASSVTGIPVRTSDGSLDEGKLYAGLSALFDCGVKDIAVIHAPEGGFALDASGMFVTCPSFRLPEGYIVGKTGAGDAFCAGILYGISCGWNMEESLRFANGAAASSLRGSGGTETVGSRAEIESLMDELEVYSNHSE
jgi:sugar/nucleoside kinase (ribokinase family)